MEKAAFIPPVGAVTFEIFDQTLFEALAKSDEPLHIPLIGRLSFPQVQERSTAVLEKTIYIQKIFPENTCNLSTGFETTNDTGPGQTSDWNKQNFDRSFSFLMDYIVFPKVWLFEGYIHQHELDDASEKMSITVLYLPEQETGSFAFHSKSEIPIPKNLQYN